MKRVPTIERGLRFRPRVSREAVAGRSLRKLVSDLSEDRRGTRSPA